MKQIAHKVEYFLNNYPATRNNDFDLAFEIWERGGISFTEAERNKIKEAHKLCSFYTVERTRREFREKYPADPNIEAGRRQEELRYYDHYKN